MAPKEKISLKKNKRLHRTICLIFLMVLFYACANKNPHLFTQLPSRETGVSFVNPNVDKDTLSFLDYLYFYNGAGVTIGDINNDGLPDIFLLLIPKAISST